MSAWSAEASQRRAVGAADGGGDQRHPHGAAETPATSATNPIVGATGSGAAASHDDDAPGALPPRATRATSRAEIDEAGISHSLR